MGKKLNIGCAKTILEGFVNCDLRKGPGVDKQFDLQGPWPFSDESVEYIRASHIMEHLQDRIACFKEANRVLEPNGILEIWSPYGDGSHNPDPFHTYPPLWPNSFDYLFLGNKDQTTLECGWEEPLFKPEKIEVIRIFWQRGRLEKVIGKWISKRYTWPRIGIPVEIHWVLRRNP